MEEEEHGEDDLEEGMDENLGNLSHDVGSTIESEGGDEEDGEIAGNSFVGDADNASLI